MDRKSGTPESQSGTSTSTKLDAGEMPSFFVVGPPRTGTSWLHEVLNPHALLPRHVKETRFFDLYFHRGFDWYLKYFDQSQSISRTRGEIAPTYFASPQARDRIARTIPGAKIVCIFRHPVQRAFSLYRLKHAYGMIRGNFEEALRHDPEIQQSGRYATNLKAWQEALGPGQVLPTFYDHLRDQPQSYIENVANYIGIPRFALTPDQIRFVHTSEGLTQPRHVASTRFAVALAQRLKTRHLDRLACFLRNSPLAKFFLSGGRPFARLSAAASRSAVELFRGEVEELESMLNVDLSAWKSPVFDLYDSPAQLNQPFGSATSRGLPAFNGAEATDRIA